MSERAQRAPGRDRQRAALIGLGVAFRVAAARIRQKARQMTDADAEPAGSVTPPGPSYTFRRGEWRCFGPTHDTPWRCRYCGSEHRLAGHAIYTHGCRPAAMPAGLCSGFATYPVVDNAVPAIGHPPCPGGPVYRFVGRVRVVDTREVFDDGYVREPGAKLVAPHEHPEITWID